MLLNSSYNASAYTTEHPLAYNTVDTLLDDMSLQMASSNLSRRCSQKGSRPGSMRVVKTASASNSPRNSSGLLRRRTVMTDNQYRRHALLVAQSGIGQVDIGGLYDGLNTTSRTSRPVSWHPGSEIASEATQSPYLVPRIQLDEHFRPYELPPTPAVFSGYASPASTFSPGAQTFTAYEQNQYPFFEDNTNVQSTSFDLLDNLYTQYPQSTFHDQTDDLSATMDNQMNSSLYPQFDWNHFAVNGFNNTTAPPTPENFLPIQHPTPSLEAEESIPYHPLEDSEPTGEILVGMGLYDTPEKANPSDPQLDKYRSLLMTQLLGPAHRKPEPTGKGLKLEETWAPASDDGEEDDNDDGSEEDEDEDADGSATEDDAKDVPSAATKQDIPVYTQDFLEKGNFAPNNLSSHYPDVQYGGVGWL